MSDQGRESEDGTFEDEEVVFTVDAWENQRYKPMQGGWQPPFVSGVPNMSDISGTHTIGCEGGMPLCSLPAGWEWLCEWTVDATSKLYGGCDGDGWSYASSFETLFEQCSKQILSGEMGRLSLVRRRRWVRRRRCVTAAARRQFQSRIFWNQSLRQRLDRVLSSREADFAVLQQYETRRRSSFDDAVGLADSILAETVRMLEGVGDKLGQMKTFLHERGQIEREYAERLGSLANKWRYAGQSPHYMPPADGSPPPNAGFFYVVSSANQIFSSCLGDFASLLDGALPLDVEGIIQEVLAVKNDCTYEGPSVRAALRVKEEAAQRALARYKQAVSAARVFGATERARLSSSLYAGSVSAQLEAGRAGSSALSSLAAAGAGGDGGDLGSSSSSSSSSPASARKPSSSSSSSPLPLSSSSFSSNGGPGSSDVWVCLQQYYKACSDTDGELLIYCAFATQQRKVARLVGNRVAALLQSTVKVFAHEQCRAFEDGVTELRKVGSRISAAAAAAAAAGGAPSFARSSTGASLSQDEDEGIMGLINPSLPTRPSCGAVAKFGTLKLAVPQQQQQQQQGGEAAGQAPATPSRASSYSGPPSSAGSPLSALLLSSAAADALSWLPVLAVITFDGTLLLFQADALRDARGGEGEGAGRGEGEEEDEGEPSLVALAMARPLAVLDLSACTVEPLLLPSLDAIAVRPRAAERSPFQLIGSPSTPGGPSSHAASSAGAAQVTLLAEGPDAAREWMRLMSTPLCDPHHDPPSES